MSSNPKPQAQPASAAPTSPNLSKSAPSLPSSLDPSPLSLRRRALLPSALTDDGTTTETEDVPSSEPPLRPPFSPFFTIIEDATTSEHYHPSVHYIFSDDDHHDLLTDAALHALSNDAAEHTTTSSLSAFTQQHQQGTEKGGENSNGSHSSPSSSSTSKNKIVRERYLIVDVGPSGDTIVSARSLTADWQALGAEVSNAPTWEAASEGSTKTGGLMLKIEGTEGLGSDRDGVEGEDLNEQGMAELVELFEKRMALLRKVVEGGEKTVRLI